MLTTHEIIQHDLFCRGGMNRSGGAIYALILQAPRTITQLADKTGLSRSTVHRALKRMAETVDPQTGEVIPLVCQVGRLWHAVSGQDLNQLARLRGVAGMRERRAVRHEAERRNYRAFLLRNPSFRRRKSRPHGQSKP